MTSEVIGYAGMTHLGLNSAAAAADKGFGLVCYDPDPLLIAALERGELPVVEPDLPELLEKNARRIRFTADPDELASCGMVYVAPDVPTDDHGQSDLGRIDALISQVDAVLRPDAVMVILSQVPPGFTRGRLRAGRTLYYQVETLIFGRAVERALYPERFIVGCAEPRQPLPPVFARFLASFGCPILPMRYESAELAKISINMCLVASVGVANTMAELCEQTGADWSEIVPALKLDKRIGQYSYLAPGLGIAGGNLERDLATVCNFADRYGTDAGVVRAWVANSRHRRDWALRTLYREVLSRTDDPVIAVLGLAYKQDTHSTKNSPSIALLENLKPFRVRVFDPVVPATAAPNPRCHGAASEREACEGADALAIMTPWGQFSKLDLGAIAAKLRGKLVLDPYCVLNAAECRKAGLRRLTLGVQD
ncbi:MAG: GDP-mannose dehydrogenase [Betaproteobacteria bacterium RBG_16_64_18]|nr:MAG: GDP-mannose dehydrogenase [Betaproteobacteria bacterium RBG_16_64_18]